MNPLLKRLHVVLVLAVILFSAIAGVQFVRLASANFLLLPIPTPQPAIYIKSDGRVDPLKAPIKRAGDVYTFTDDIIGYTIAVERDKIVIDGGGYALQGNGNSTGFFLKNRKNVTVRNMEIRNFSYGISLIAETYLRMSSESNIVSGNNITNNTYGIYTWSSSSNVLKNNHMNNNKYGIYISSYSEKNVLSENTVTNSTYGIYIGSSSNVLRNNHMNNNKYNLGLYANINDIDVSNTVDGKPVYYWVNQHKKTVPADAGYIALVNCTNITVQNLKLANNGQGILLVSTTDSVITKNTITNNADGIRIKGSSNNNVFKNYITNNENGIYLSSSSNNTISGNRITANTKAGISVTDFTNNNTFTQNYITNNQENGIDLQGSSNNSIYENNIAGNTGWGIRIWFGSKNAVFLNYVANNSVGIVVADSVQNRITNNMVTENNGWGIQLVSHQKDNVIYHNNFINNKGEEGLQASIGERWGYHGWSAGLGNVWDDGKEGNYWSDYVTRYPNATEVPGAGIWDTPYYINYHNIDKCPLMEPVEIPPITIPEFPDDEKPTIPNLNPTPLLMAVPIGLAIILGLAFYRRKNNRSNKVSSGKHQFLTMRAHQLTG